MQMYQIIYAAIIAKKIITIVVRKFLVGVSVSTYFVFLPEILST